MTEENNDQSTAIDPLTIGELINALETNNEDVQFSTAYNLVKIGEPAVTKLIDSLKSDDARRPLVSRILVSIGETAVTPLIVTLDNANDTVCLAVLQILGVIGSAKATKQIIHILEKGNSQLGAVAAEALGRIGDKQAIVPLVASLKHKNTLVRANAAWALGQIGDMQGIIPLINALKDNDSLVRANAAAALAKIGDIRALEDLEEMYITDEGSNLWDEKNAEIAYDAIIEIKRKNGLI